MDTGKSCLVGGFGLREDEAIEAVLAAAAGLALLHEVLDVVSALVAKLIDPGVDVHRSGDPGEFRHGDPFARGFLEAGEDEIGLAWFGVHGGWWFRFRSETGRPGG